MDLGSIIGGVSDVVDIYNRVKYGPTGGTTIQPYPGPISTTPAFLPDFGYDVEADIPFLDIVKKKKRRRRRRLATVSDIKDLAALKAVLGNGEAFKTWIATHSR